MTYWLLSHGFAPNQNGLQMVSSNTRASHLPFARQFMVKAVGSDLGQQPEQKATWPPNDPYLYLTQKGECGGARIPACKGDFQLEKCGNQQVV